MEWMIPFFVFIIVLQVLTIVLILKLLNKKRIPPSLASFHAIMFINLSLKKIKKGDNIMEGNAQVDQLGLLVFDGPKDKYENPTTLDGDANFSSSDENIATFTKATQEQIDEYNNDPGTLDADKIPAANFPYTGSVKTNKTVGAVLLKIKGPNTNSTDSTDVESSFTLNVGAGAASSFGTVKLVGVKEDPDAD